MEGVGLAQLAAKLLAVAAGLTGYGLPAEAPAVVLVPHDRLEALACGQPCRVYGWFPPGETIYLDRDLDLLNDPGARSILLHELVHYLQQKSGTFPAEGDCRSWLSREREAYDVQFRWLAERRAPRAALARFGLRPASLSCHDDDRVPALPLEPGAE